MPQPFAAAACAQQQPQARRSPSSLRLLSNTGAAETTYESDTAESPIRAGLSRSPRGAWWRWSRPPACQLQASLFSGTLEIHAAYK
jgi:hypothetical protein